MAKTSVQLNYATSIWPVVEKWAVENNYLLETPGQHNRLYVRRSEEAGSTIYVAISQTDENVQLSAWFSDLIRGEMAIDSPSLYSALSRIDARSDFQKLLSALGYNPPRKTKSKKKKGNFAFKLGRSVRKLSGKK